MKSDQERREEIITTIFIILQSPNPDGRRLQQLRSELNQIVNRKETTMKQIQVRNQRLQRVLDAIKPWHLAAIWVAAIVLLILAIRL